MPAFFLIFLLIIQADAVEKPQYLKKFNGYIESGGNDVATVSRKVAMFVLNVWGRQKIMKKAQVTPGLYLMG